MVTLEIPEPDNLMKYLLNNKFLRMKTKFLYRYTSLLILVIFIFITSCKEEDDYTGDSVVSPNNVSLTITPSVPGATLVEGDQTFTFDVILSGEQVSDVEVKVFQTGGDAVEGDDFEMDHTVLIPAGSLTGTGEITILSDAVIEGTETLQIQIGDDTTANAGNVTPATMSFDILNYEEGDLNIELSWHPEAYDQYGSQISSTSIADMILYLVDPNGDVIGEVDGGSYEHYVLSSAAMDGTYTIKTGFYSAMSFNDPVDLELMLDYEQVGVFVDSQDFSGLATTATAESCDLEIFLAEIEKSGDTYTLSENAFVQYALDTSIFPGTYDGADGSVGDGFDWQFSNPVTVAMSGDDLTIDGLNYTWMSAIWGETVTSSTPVIINFYNDGTVEIPEQYYMTTDFDGTLYDYSIYGSGTWNSCNPYSLHIEYEMNQDGFLVAQWLQDNGYSYTNYFIADISL